MILDSFYQKFDADEESWQELTLKMNISQNNKKVLKPFAGLVTGAKYEFFYEYG